MEKENRFSFLVYGRKALFSDPLTRVGGEKFSYPIPTYQALKGIAESVFWKPTIVIVPLRVRILNPIRTRSEGIRPIGYNGGNTLSTYTYLTDVAYQVEAKFIWNECRPDLCKDRNENKYYFMMQRMIEKGGRRDIFFGTRECQGYVEPCVFNEGLGAYDKLPEMEFGVMVHGISYPDETGKDTLQVRLWRPKMVKGVIEFPSIEDCTIVRTIRKGEIKTFTLGGNIQPIDEMTEEVMQGELE